MVVVVVAVVVVVGSIRVARRHSNWIVIIVIGHGNLDVRREEMHWRRSVVGGARGVSTITESVRAGIGGCCECRQKMSGVRLLQRQQQ